MLSGFAFAWSVQVAVAVAATIKAAVQMRAAPGGKHLLVQL
jgi:hypothetical protein